MLSRREILKRLGLAGTVGALGVRPEVGRVEKEEFCGYPKEDQMRFINQAVRVYLSDADICYVNMGADAVMLPVRPGDTSQRFRQGDTSHIRISRPRTDRQTKLYRAAYEDSDA
jgi:hypothetical protein